MKIPLYIDVEDDYCGDCVFLDIDSFDHSDTKCMLFNEYLSVIRKISELEHVLIRCRQCKRISDT